jgi:hypothetical protein
VRRRVGHGGPEWYFRESMVTPCHTPMVVMTPSGRLVRPVQGWPPIGCRMGGLGEALDTLSRFNPIFDMFRITVNWEDHFHIIFIYNVKTPRPIVITIKYVNFLKVGYLCTKVSTH